jgi:hypothetical protein
MEGTGSAADEPFPWEEPLTPVQTSESQAAEGGVQRERGSELEDHLPVDEEPPFPAEAGEQGRDNSFEAYLAFDDEPRGNPAPMPTPAPRSEDAPPPPAPEPAPAPTPAGGQEEDDDLESFQTWLRSLKR